MVWNLTLAANLISANVPYGEIEAIRGVDGVKDVVLEAKYEPCKTEQTTADGPMMATSGNMIGTSVAYAAGYTGAGRRIAVIDTGIDLDHQSFDAGAFDYALAELGGNYNLLSAEEIAKVLPQLNAAARTKNLTAEQLYKTSKIPYGYNYVDHSAFYVDHDGDTQGEHGSHVEGIAAANRYVPNGDGTYSKALDTVLVQGVAPDAQLIVMKVFGKGGGAYDSDYMAAVKYGAIATICVGLHGRDRLCGERHVQVRPLWRLPHCEVLCADGKRQAVSGVGAHIHGRWILYRSERVRWQHPAESVRREHIQEQ